MTHNSDYVDAGAAAVADPQRDLDGKRIEYADTVWLGDLAGLFLAADREGDIWLTCGKCAHGTLIRSGKVSVTNGRPDGYDFGSYVANAVNEALEHKCPDTK